MIIAKNPSGQVDGQLPPIVGFALLFISLERRDDADNRASNTRTTNWQS